MYKVDETIIVEGVYDKIRLSGFIDGVIIALGGFGIFNDHDLLKSIKTLSEKTGVVILTDSDAAGFKIRNFIKNTLNPDNVKHAYIPSIKGKERRKLKPGKEGLLGVEGVSEDIILKALRNAGCVINGEKNVKVKTREIKKSDLYEYGFSGGEKSAELRRIMAEELNLPTRISANMMLDVLNRLFTYEEYVKLAEDLRNRADIGDKTENQNFIKNF